MKLKNFSPFVIALVAGAALGYCLKPNAPVKAEEPKTDTAAQTKPAIEDRGERASNRALRARVRELEKKLADLGQPQEEAKVEEQRLNGERRRDFGGDMRDMLERIKKEDPERYAQMTNGFARMRQGQRNRAQSKLDFLSAVDTSRMSAAAKKTHNELQEMIAKRDELEQKMGSMLEMSDEERRQAFEEMRETHERIRDLNRAERDNLLQETAKSLGLQGDDASDLAQTVKDIYEVTENGWGGPGPGGFGGGRGGRGGRGGFGGGRGNR